MKKKKNIKSKMQILQRTGESWANEKSHSFIRAYIPPWKEYEKNLLTGNFKTAQYLFNFISTKIVISSGRKASAATTILVIWHKKRGKNWTSANFQLHARFSLKANKRVILEYDVSKLWIWGFQFYRIWSNIKFHARTMYLWDNFF